MAGPPVILHLPEWADPWSHPEYYLGITAKRVVAYLIDALAIAILVLIAWAGLAIAGILTLGLAWAMLGLPSILVPLLYHILQIAGPHSATFGMRLMGIRVMSLSDPYSGGRFESGHGRPTQFQAIIQTFVFYGSMAVTGSLILLAALFNARLRTLHDWLAGTVVINRLPV